MPQILKNKSARNLVWQFAGQGTAKVSMFFFYLLLPLFIGVSEYGKFAYALAISSIAVQPIVEMGLDVIIVKWVSRGKMDVLKKVSIIRAIAALIALFILLIISPFLRVDNQVLFVLFPYFVLTSFQNIFFSFFRGIENMKLEGVMVPLQKFFMLSLFLLLNVWGLKTALLGPIAFLFPTLLGAVFLLFVFLADHRLEEISIMTDKSGSLRYSDLIKEGAVLGAVNFLWLIYFRIDSVMLGMMTGESEVGIYNVAYRIMEGVFFIPYIIMSVYFPVLVKRNRFKEIFIKLLFLLGGLGIVSSVALYVFSPIFIRTIYGHEFLNSISVLQILSFVIFPVFLGHLTTQSLVALDLNRLYLLVAFIGTGINVVLNYFLIPPLGGAGAAWATLVTETLVALLCGYFIWREGPKSLGSLSITSTAKKNIVQ